MFRLSIFVVPALVVCLYAWQAENDPQPGSAGADALEGTSRSTGGTMEPADTCIGRALRGRQAPHAPQPSL